MAPAAAPSTPEKPATQAVTGSASRPWPLTPATKAAAALAKLNVQPPSHNSKAHESTIVVVRDEFFDKAKEVAPNAKVIRLAEHHVSLFTLTCTGTSASGNPEMKDILPFCTQNTLSHEIRQGLIKKFEGDDATVAEELQLWHYNEHLAEQDAVDEQIAKEIEAAATVTMSADDAAPAASASAELPLTPSKRKVDLTYSLTLFDPKDKAFPGHGKDGWRDAPAHELGQYLNAKFLLSHDVTKEVVGILKRNFLIFDGEKKKWKSTSKSDPTCYLFLTLLEAEDFAAASACIDYYGTAADKEKLKTYNDHGGQQTAFQHLVATTKTTMRGPRF